VPVNSLWNIGTGIADFTSGKTHDIRAVFGYSEAMRGKYLRSDDYDVIHKHLPEYGGDLNGLFNEVAEKEGIRYLMRHKDRLAKEYVLYSQFGGWDRHVNFLYTTLSKNEQRAEYIHDLYTASVGGKRDFATRNKALADGLTNEEMTHEEFMNRMALWEGLGVISKGVIEMFEAKRIGKFDEIYKF